MKHQVSAFLLAMAVLASACSGPRDGKYSFRILTTNDVHGTYFDSTNTGTTVKKSLISVKRTVDSVRTAMGKDNVILIDAGDILQGDNAAYYYNYIDTVTPHVYPRMARYMGYDAVVLGNHDIET
ncbi:MAG: metallophosphoesterase, partial [Bacteroidales bacterium]|nr:metallophosphoesterase [Bacteroidales bacterium]